MARNLLIVVSLAALPLLGCKEKECPDPGKVAAAPGPVTAEAPPPTTGGLPAPPAGKPTVDETVAFAKEVDAGLRRVWLAQGRADWINSTYITEDTDALAADAAQVSMEFLTSAIKASVRFADVTGLPEDVARQMTLLRRSATLPSPSDAEKRKILAETAVGMQSDYGKGKYCGSKTLGAWVPKDAKDDCLSLAELSAVLESPKATWDQLLEAWTGWRTIAPPMRDDYQRFVSLGNDGAKELGFGNVGDVWKSRYDMPAAELETDVERLWQQVKPLYDQLHCYVRTRLSSKWGADKVPASGAIPAHLFGNMWSQTWGGIYDTVAPYPKEASLDVTKALVKAKYTTRKMVETAEGFYVSLGMPELPETFWTRSMIDKPRDRDAVCHASAWDLTYNNDVRIKMCTLVNEEDLSTLHHELGHNYYFTAYHQLPMLFQDGANDGFHEAIGDTMALSVTPDYLVKLGLFEAVPGNEKNDLNQLMRRALDKVAFLPFGMLIDKWRWDVFAGKTSPEAYNQAWWDLVLKYQGIAPPSPRGEEFFDPGAKYHVPANTPYLRYFLADIYQFQFHRALCKASGHTGPLHACSIFGSKEAGEKMWAMLQMGASKPWPEAMKVVTGETQADASAMLEYFAPLQTWLAEQNKGQQCGW